MMRGMVCCVLGKLYSAARRTSLGSAEKLNDSRCGIVSQHVEQDLEQGFASFLGVVLAFSILKKGDSKRGLDADDGFLVPRATE